LLKLNGGGFQRRPRQTYGSYIIDDVEGNNSNNNNNNNNNNNKLLKFRFICTVDVRRVTILENL